MNDQELDTFIDELYDTLRAFGVPYPASTLKREADGSVTVIVQFSLEPSP